MILDTLSLIDRYATLNPRFVSAFDFLRRLGSDPVIGRHDIDGDVVYALVQRYETRPVAGMRLEAHRRYIDIQYVVRGSEAIYSAVLAGEAGVDYAVATRSKSGSIRLPAPASSRIPAVDPRPGEPLVLRCPEHAPGVTGMPVRIASIQLRKWG